VPGGGIEKAQYISGVDSWATLAGTGDAGSNLRAVKSRVTHKNLSCRTVMLVTAFARRVYEHVENETAFSFLFPAFYLQGAV
jgi:hypothetical protein